jgi:Transposase
LKKNSNSRKKSEATTKRAKSRGPVQRDTKEVLAELVGKLKEKLDPKKAAAASAEDRHPRGKLRPNLDRLTVGVDLGDQWSHYCILGLEGETLAEGQLRTTQEDFAIFFQGLNAARVVVEVGTHSAWVQELISGCGHEVLVANPRLMEGSKRRKRKNDRIDANKLARLGRVDPESLHSIQHRSREVRQDLVMLRARDALVAARTDLINTTRGLDFYDLLIEAPRPRSVSAVAIVLAIYPKPAAQTRYVDLLNTFVIVSSMQAAAWAAKSPIGLSAKLLTAFIRPVLPS